MINAAAFHVYRLLSREPATVEVVTNVVFGRRLSAREASKTRWAGVLDLAAEFPSTRWPARTKYTSLPLLDATAPREGELIEAITIIFVHAITGPVYVHCALGHGRSACVVAAYLLNTKVVATAREAERHLRNLRPGVRLNAMQLRAVGLFGIT